MIMYWTVEIFLCDDLNGKRAAATERICCTDKKAAGEKMINFTRETKKKLLRVAALVASLTLLYLQITPFPKHSLFPDYCDFPPSPSPIFVSCQLVCSFFCFIPIFPLLFLLWFIQLVCSLFTPMCPSYTPLDITLMLTSTLLLVFLPFHFVSLHSAPALP